jgi:predicted phage-related endonuclease
MLDHELRRQGISGTDLGALLGDDPYRDAHDVWEQKQPNYERLPPTPFQRLGLCLEGGNLEYYAETTGRKIVRDNITRCHPVRAWQIGTPDALVEGEKRGVDSKIVFWAHRTDFGPGPSGDDLPLRYRTQAHWYMDLMDYDAWDVIALSGGELPRIYTLHRDPEFEAALRKIAFHFYRRHVLGNEEPPLGGGASAHAYLKRIYPRNYLDLRDASREEVEMLLQFAIERAKLKTLEEQVSTLEVRIKQAIGPHDGIVAPGSRFTWKVTRPSKETDWYHLANTLLANAIEGGWIKPEEGQKLIEQYTTMKPGVRRMHFVSKSGKETADAA